MSTTTRQTRSYKMISYLMFSWVTFGPDVHVGAPLWIIHTFHGHGIPCSGLQERRQVQGVDFKHLCQTSPTLTGLKGSEESTSKDVRDIWHRWL